MRKNNIRPFSTVKDKELGRKLTNGTYRVGYIQSISPSDLLKCFGLPTFIPEDSGDSKVHVEWVVKFKDPQSSKENVFTVYDWRFDFDPFEYPDKRYRFNVGSRGSNFSVVNNFINSVNNYL